MAQANDPTMNVLVNPSGLTQIDVTGNATQEAGDAFPIPDSLDSTTKQTLKQIMVSIWADWFKEGPYVAENTVLVSASRFVQYAPGYDPNGNDVFEELFRWYDFVFQGLINGESKKIKIHHTDGVFDESNTVEIIDADQPLGSVNN